MTQHLFSGNKGSFTKTFFFLNRNVDLQMMIGWMSKFPLDLSWEIFHEIPVEDRESDAETQHQSVI